MDLREDQKIGKYGTKSMHCTRNSYYHMNFMWIDY